MPYEPLRYVLVFDSAQIGDTWERDAAREEAKRLLQTAPAGTKAQIMKRSRGGPLLNVYEATDDQWGYKITEPPQISELSRMRSRARPGELLPFDRWRIEQQMQEATANVRAPSWWRGKPGEAPSDEDWFKRWQKENAEKMTANTCAPSPRPPKKAAKKTRKPKR